jgi:histone deacetylase 1/2
MPLKFWDEAFLTATFLINLLPSKVIQNETPVERLLNTSPNYESLRIFGCACWPNLRPYNKRKLAYRSKRCVFLGYSPLHKGVKCLDVTTGHVYISRDVVFDENVFPFASLHPNAGKRLREETLLLPPQNTACTNGDASHVDHMPLPIIPIVTNHVQDTPPPDDDRESLSDAEHDGENLTENDEETSENSSQENVAENDELGADSEEDSPATSYPSDPEADPVSSVRGRQQQQQQSPHAGPAPFRVYTRRLRQPS